MRDALCAYLSQIPAKSGLWGKGLSWKIGVVGVTRKDETKDCEDTAKATPI